mmetsp:Transcript_52162/g.169437  ORF Transcript_52162/g.169437 Transcript_52162/m.169437 type:complete len:258 (+) Transcript_52162:264-1037(+)
METKPGCSNARIPLLAGVALDIGGAAAPALAAPVAARRALGGEGRGGGRRRGRDAGGGPGGGVAIVEEPHGLLHLRGGAAEGGDAQRQYQAYQIACPIHRRPRQACGVGSREHMQGHTRKEWVQEEINEQHGNAICYCSVHAGEAIDQDACDPTMEDHRKQSDIDQPVAAPTQKHTAATDAGFCLLEQRRRIANERPIDLKFCRLLIAPSRGIVDVMRRDAHARPIVGPRSIDPIRQILPRIPGHCPHPAHDRQEQD